MTRGRLLWLLGAGALALGAVLLAVDEPMWDAGGPGIVGFELAASEDRAREILVEWGEEGRDAARVSLWLDFAYLALYGAFWALAAAAIRDLARDRGWRRFAAAGSVAIVLAPAAAAFDALEDVCLLLVLGGDGGTTSPVLAAVFATVKFLCIGLAVLYVVAGLARRFPRTAVGVAAAALVLLALNTWVVERETKAARPDIGRVLELPGGDIQVREDGSLRDPPLLLIHGFGCSLRWWDRVVPALAREHRVIRVDLLGHGGSAKPRSGYAMEQQADLVAAAARRLGVRRTAVVGHSMGGIVATAIVERHRELVTRVMTIGTPPDDQGEGPPIYTRPAFWPVTGHAIRTLAPDSAVRAEAERTSPPRFDITQRLARDISDRATYTSLRKSGEAIADYWDERPLDERLADERLPLTVVYGPAVDGEEDAALDFRGVPGVRLVRLAGLGHSPQLERPRRAAAVILEFARKP